MRSPLILKIIAWAAFCACVVAWTGVWFVDSAITDAAATREEERQSADQQLTRDTAQARTQALIDDTAQARTQLSQLVSIDVVAAANIIESISASSGAVVQVSSASEEPPVNTAIKTPLHAIGFVVSATGDFAAVMRAAKLLETLPFPSSIEQLDLTLVPDSGTKKTPQWRMSEKIQMLTSATISS